LFDPQKGSCPFALTAEEKCDFLLPYESAALIRHPSWVEMELLWKCLKGL